MTCHCFIKHATTPDERKSAASRLREARDLGDTNGIIIAIAVLTGECPAKNEPGLNSSQSPELSPEIARY